MRSRFTILTICPFRTERIDRPIHPDCVSERLSFPSSSLCVRSVTFFTFRRITVLVQSQHGHIQYPWMFLCYFVFALILTVKLTVFTYSPYKPLSGHVFTCLPNLWYKSVLYSCWFIYPANFSFSSLTFPTHYAIIFLVLGVVLALARGSRHL